MITDIEIENKFAWMLFFMSDNTVGSISGGYCEPFDGDNKAPFKYSGADLYELERIKKETPEPKFSDNYFEAQQQLSEYGDKIRAEFNSKNKK